MPTLIILIVVIVAVIVVYLLTRQSRSVTPPTSGSPGVVTTIAREQPSENVEDALALLSTCARRRDGANLTAVVGIRVTDHRPADWHFDLDGGSCALRQGAANNAAVTLRGNTRTWMALANKQVSFTGAAMNGSLETDGDASVLIRLDDELAGPPDRSRLAAVPNPSPNQATEDVLAPADSAEAALPLGTTGPTLHEIIQMTRDSAKLPPEERRAAMINALHQKLGPGAEVRIAEGGSFTFASTEQVDLHAVQATVRQALQSLPSGATREQKLEAVRAALRDVPNAQHLLAILDAAHARHQAHTGGFGAELAGSLVEGLLEAFLGG